MWIEGVLAFIWGLVIGSFLNVVIYRTVKGESPFVGRSRCDYCKKKIEWWYNIPLLSFFWLKGRCRHCHKKISWQYPMVELLSGALFVWWWVMGRGFFLLAAQPFVWWQPVFWLGVGVMLLMVAVYDQLYGIIPDALNWCLFVWVLLYRVALVGYGEMRAVDFGLALICGGVVMAFFWSLWMITRGKGFGLGDVKLAPALGLLLGWPKSVVGIMLAFLSGAVVAVYLLVKGKKKLGQTLPFGPFLVLGTVVGLWMGGVLWEAYLGLLH